MLLSTYKHVELRVAAAGTFAAYVRLFTRGKFSSFEIYRSLGGLMAAISIAQLTPSCCSYSTSPLGQSLNSEFRGLCYPLALKQRVCINHHSVYGRFTIVSDGGRQPWDIGRFIKTVTYFNEPPSFRKLLETLKAVFTGSSAKEQSKKESLQNMETVLVTGATGGVGAAVVNALRKRGIPVRVLVRNPEKAKQLFPTDIDMVLGDVTKKETLLPEYFEGVKKVVNVVSALLRLKEPFVGQKDFRPCPEIVGDSPEAVEYNGMKNIIEAVKDHIGLRDGKILFGVSAKGLPSGQAWGPLDDVVMGGVSESSMHIDLNGGEDGGAVGVFKGFVSTDNNGGFASIRTKNFPSPENLSAYDGLKLQLKGDGHRYKLIIRTSVDWDALGYTASFDTKKNQWQSVCLPFSMFVPTFRARTVRDARPFDTSKVMSLQLMYSKFEYDGKLNDTFEPGPFELPFSSIRAYLKEPITPRFVHVSSAGVTRPHRPGIDLSKQPPIIRMNDTIGYLLDFKLKGEDLLRESGIPFTVVRPCSLTSDPAGAELTFEQGDNIMGRTSTYDVADICVAALELPSASDLTFEVKTTSPVSKALTVDAENPPTERDFKKIFGTLKKGITGKEPLEKAIAGKGAFEKDMISV